MSIIVSKCSFDKFFVCTNELYMVVSLFVCNLNKKIRPIKNASVEASQLSFNFGLSSFFVNFFSSP